MGSLPTAAREQSLLAATTVSPHKARNTQHSQEKKKNQVLSNNYTIELRQQGQWSCKRLPRAWMLQSVPAPQHLQTHCRCPSWSLDTVPAVATTFSRMDSAWPRLLSLTSFSFKATCTYLYLGFLSPWHPRPSCSGGQELSYLVTPEGCSVS